MGRILNGLSATFRVYLKGLLAPLYQNRNILALKMNSDYMIRLFQTVFGKRMILTLIPGLISNLQPSTK